MVRTNRLGLVLVDGPTAMEGNGPGNGTLVPMDVIIAGPNPLTTDMVAASVMGFEPDNIPIFVAANKTSMGSQSLDEIEIRGESISRISRRFARPDLFAWNDMCDTWSVQEMP